MLFTRTCTLPVIACVFGVLALAGGLPSCSPTSGENGDCTLPQPATSAFDLQIIGTGLPASDFSVVAVGSAGDKLALKGSNGPDGSPQFTGVCKSGETYQVTVTLDGVTFYDQPVGFSVAGCEFLVQIDVNYLDGGLPFDSGS